LIAAQSCDPHGSDFDKLHPQGIVILEKGIVDVKIQVPANRAGHVFFDISANADQQAVWR
jgi:hypothetical protein